MSRFAPDLYPRQRMGFVMVLVGLPLEVVAFVSGATATPALLVLTLYLGVGLGMMAGNTRTLRTRSGTGWRSRRR